MEYAQSTIQDFFDHILQCQLGQGPERAFRFKAIKARDGTLSPTHYPDELSNPTPFRRASKHSGRMITNAGTETAPVIPNNSKAVPTTKGKKGNKGKSKRGQRDSNANARSATGTERDPNGQHDSDPIAKRRGKRGRTGIPNSDSNPSTITDTAESELVQVDQMQWMYYVHMVSLDHSQ